MTTAQELELFDFLSRQPRLREWLTAKRESAVKILVQSSDIEYLRKAQGQVAIIDQMTNLMDAAHAAVNR